MANPLEAIRTRAAADRAATYESEWTVLLHQEPRVGTDADAGVGAMRDVYNALTSDPITSWQRETLAAEENVSTEVVGAPIGRGLVVDACQYPDAGNPRD